MHVDREVVRQLLGEVLGVDLDVAGLVHHLGRRVVLGVDPRHRLHDLGRADERALLAVHELAQHPALPAAPRSYHSSSESFSNGVPTRSSAMVVFMRVVGVTGDGPRVDVDAPVDVGGDVPLRRLGLLVQLRQLRRGCARSPR